MKRCAFFTAGLLLAALPAMASDFEERQKLRGSWQESGGDPAKTWNIEETDSQLHVTAREKGQTVLEFRCNTFGKECEFKENGKPAKITMWYNGPALVAMESRGNDVLKRRFQAAPDGSGLRIEVIHISPAGKPETVELKRAGTTATAQ